jgi:hypothetical protein
MSKHLVGKLLRGIHAGEKDLAWNHMPALRIGVQPLP